MSADYLGGVNLGENRVEFIASQNVVSEFKTSFEVSTLLGQILSPVAFQALPRQDRHLLLFKEVLGVNEEAV
jgi:hypothetical protein